MILARMAVSSLIVFGCAKGWKAALDGIPLTLDTLVEDHYTHETSVELHLEVICLVYSSILPWGVPEIDDI